MPRAAGSACSRTPRYARIGDMGVKSDRNKFADRMVRVFESDVFTHDAITDMKWDASAGGSLMIRMVPRDEEHIEDLKSAVVDKIRRESVENPEEPFGATAAQWLVDGVTNLFLKLAPKQPDKTAHQPA